MKTTLAPGSKVVVDYYERSGPHPVSGQARLQPRRLRLHHLHRQLRPAAAGDLRRRQRGRSGRRFSAFRQPQLRGPHQSRREDELPRVAAAGRRVRARRDDGPRHHEGPARAPEPTASRSTSPTCGRRRRRSPTSSATRSSPTCSPATTPTSSPATSAGRACRSATPGRRRSPGTTASTYVRKPPYFEGMEREPAAVADIEGARVLAMLGDSVTTDHISPAGSIKKDSPAGRYLSENGVDAKDFNSYGSRRGNHEVMIRGTFANIRLRNQLAPGTEGGVTRHLPDGEQASIYDAAQQYAADGVPLVVLAGKEYGSGSSRDWAAKGTALLGVRAVIAESYERIHRSNLIGMGVLPLQYPQGETRESLGLTGEEEFTIRGLADVSRRDRDDLRCRRATRASTRWCASTRPGRRSTSGTAGSCRTCCARCSSGDRSRGAARRSRSADRPRGRRAARRGQRARHGGRDQVLTDRRRDGDGPGVRGAHRRAARRAAPRRRPAGRRGLGTRVGPPGSSGSSIRSTAP